MAYNTIEICTSGWRHARTAAGRDLPVDLCMCVCRLPHSSRVRMDVDNFRGDLGPGQNLQGIQSKYRTTAKYSQPLGFQQMNCFHITPKM
jgi:hypothetical protein